MSLSVLQKTIAKKFELPKGAIRKNNNNNNRGSRTMYSSYYEQYPNIKVHDGVGACKK